MDDVVFARGQMAMSLAFHILFACAGMAMPLLMLLADRRYRKTRDPLDLDLAKRWAKGTAILFAVGAVSGTVLSFELGLLFPEFMKFAGPIIGMPFSLEGFAFFFEAIGLGLYLYGRDRLSPRLHFASGLLVLVSGVLSAVFVVTANAWMNQPTGFTLDAAGKVVDVDPFAAMLNPAAFTQVTHMVIAAFVAIGFAVAGVHAWRLRRHPGSAFDRKALGIALPVGAIAAVLQVFSGDLSAKHVARHQPVKFAAMEALWETQRCAPLTLGGIPDEAAEDNHLALEIPCLGSWLGFGDVDAEVLGLKDVPRELRPPVVVTHLAFQVMVGIGFFLLFVGALGGFLRWRTRALPTGRRYLLLVSLAGPLGLVAVEAGWFVTEVGRQPWVIHGLMKTSDAVTPMPGLVVPFIAFTILYVVLGVTAALLLRRHVLLAPTTDGEVR